MQASAMTKAALAILLSAPSALSTNPLGQVLSLLDDCAAKVQADADAEAKAYQEYYEWCDNVAANTQFAISTAQSNSDELQAKIVQLGGNLAASASKIDQLSSSVAADEKELADATAVRAKEAADFASSEAELSTDIDTLERAIAVLEREAAKNPAAFAQIDTSNTQKLVQAMTAVVDAASFSGTDKNRLSAMIQSQQGSDDDDTELGAPAAAAYKTHSNNIVDVLDDLKEKAEGQLGDLRKAEVNAKHNFDMLKQSLEDSIKADETDLSQEKAAKAAASQAKATAEGDLAVVSKDLANSKANLQKASTSCSEVTADHEATVKARTDELEVIAQAIKTLKETTSGGAAQSYGFLQISSRADLKNNEVVALVKDLAKKEHSAALAQLASRLAAVARFGATAGEDPFTKIKGLISGMIAKLEKESGADATEKAYCDEEMAKTEAKKADLEDTVSKLGTKADQAAATAAKRRQAVQEAQARLAALAKDQADMNSMRTQQHTNYVQAKKDLELGLSGVQKALGLLREYYGAALVQVVQPARPEVFSKSTGAGNSIISVLEVIESDFATSLAKEETQEADSLAEYEKTTQENKITKTILDQDVKYNSQEVTSLGKSIAEFSSDRQTTASELAAVSEYYGKLKGRCVAKPETYEERRARRTAEISGLKQALRILENDTALVQRKRKGLRGVMAA